MNANLKWAGLGVLAAAVLVVGAYGIGKQQGEATVVAAAPPPAAAPAAEGAPARQPNIRAMPAQHPPVGAPPAQGKVGAANAPDKRFTHFRVGNKNVKRIYVDGERVWVGTSGGLIRYDTARDEYKLFDVRSGLLSNGIFYVGRLQGRIVVGTYGGGMSLLNTSGEGWETYNVPEGLGDAFVYDVLEARNGDVWIATWSGVNRVKKGALKDGASWELYTVENTGGGLPNDWVYGLAEGKNGEIWLATEGGMARFDQGQWTNWNHARGLGAPYEKVKDRIDFRSDPARYSSHHAKQKEEMGLQGIDVAYNPNYVVALTVGPDGTVWAGTWGGGLARFDGASWTNLTAADGLPGNHIFMLHYDPGGTLWVGTNNGLARMEQGAFKVMTTADGLFSNAVFSMASAGKSLWVGSYGGVAQIRGLN